MEEVVNPDGGIKSDVADVRPLPLLAIHRRYGPGDVSDAALATVATRDSCRHYLWWVAPTTPPPPLAGGSDGEPNGPLALRRN